MSYEPQLIIVRTDLFDKQDEFCYKENDKVDQFLESLLLNPRLELEISRGVKVDLIICHPELTSFNKAVRDRLFELNIEYVESN